MRPASEPRPPVPCSPASRFEDLIPIAVVIAAGCEACSESAVANALQGRASKRDIGRVLRIIGQMRKLEGFAGAVGTAVIDRMERPPAAAEAVLHQATRRGSDASPRRGREGA